MVLCATCGMDVPEGAVLHVEFLGESADACSVQCAAEAVGLRCAHCDCPVLGQPALAAGAVYCCDHCASTARTADREAASRAV